MPYKSIGKNLARVDAVAKVTGLAKFTADLRFPRELFIRIVRSTEAHAWIKKIETSKALAIPGVRGIITGDQCQATIGVCIRDQPPLARNKVRFVGEPVSAVVAETKEIALQACREVKITYEPLPVLLESKSAMAPGAVLIHDKFDTIPGFCPEPGTNIFHHYQIRQGDPEIAMRSCPHRLQKDIHWPHLAHCQMEPHVTIARFSLDDSIEIYTSAQSPFDVRHFISEAFHIPMRKIQATTYFLGGGFGGKSDVTIEPLVVLIAKHFPGEYVRLQLDREEMFDGTVVGRGLDGEFDVAFDDGGIIHGLKVKYILNSGGYASYAINIVQPGGIVTSGPYLIPNIEISAYGVYTNRPPLGAYRAYGHPEAALLAEKMIEEIANYLHIDPIEIRRRNLLRPGCINSIGQTIQYDDGNIEACLQLVAKDLEEYRHCDDSTKIIKNSNSIATTIQNFDSTQDCKIVPVVADKNLGYGINRTNFLARGIGIGNLLKAPGMPANGFSTAIIRFNEDATVNVMISATDMGQGLLTAITQIASEALMIPVDRIEVTSFPDTRYTPYEWQTVASRSTWMVGNAVYKAAQDAISKIRMNAAVAFGQSPDDMIYDGQNVYYRFDQNQGIPIHKLMLGYSFPNGRTVGMPPLGYGAYMPEMEYASAQGQGNLAAQWTFGCQGVVLDVDVTSGVIYIRMVTSALDVGKVINPTMARSQVEGAVVMGIGGAIMEYIQYDERGKIRNKEFTDYKIPTPEDVASLKMVTHFIETPDNASIYGAKCLGEHPIIGIAPAILAGVHDAIGLDFDTLPLSAELVRAKILSNFSQVQQHLEKKRTLYVPTVSLL